MAAPPALDLHSVFSARVLPETIARTDLNPLRREDVGTIRIPSGTIAASDPFVARPAFTQRVPPGTYPVDLAIVTLLRIGGGEDHVAFVRVSFSRATPVTWRLALLPGQDPTTLGRRRTFRFGVDSGTACIADGALFGAFHADEAARDELDDQLAADDDRPVPVYRHDDGAADLIAVRTDDGSYASWFGLDEHGAPACFVVDLGHGDFARPPANPAPERVAATVAALVDERLAWVRDGDPRAAEAASYVKVRAYDEAADHVDRLLAAAAAAGGPPAFLELVVGISMREACQPRLADWLAHAPPARIEALLGASPRHARRDRLGPELAIALRGAHAAGRASTRALIACLDAFVVGTEGPLLPILLAGLGDDTADVRAKAAHAIGMLARSMPIPGEVLDALTRAAADPSPAVQDSALFALAEAAPPRRLVPLLDHPSARGRASVALRLARDPPLLARGRIRRALRELLHARELETWRRDLIAQALGEPAPADARSSFFGPRSGDAVPDDDE